MEHYDPALAQDHLVRLARDHELTLEIVRDALARGHRLSDRLVVSAAAAGQINVLLDCGMDPARRVHCPELISVAAAAFRLGLRDAAIRCLVAGAPVDAELLVEVAKQKGVPDATCEEDMRLLLGYVDGPPAALVHEALGAAIRAGSATAAARLVGFGGRVTVPGALELLRTGGEQAARVLGDAGVCAVSWRAANLRWPDPAVIVGAPAASVRAADFAAGGGFAHRLHAVIRSQVAYLLVLLAARGAVAVSGGALELAASLPRRPMREVVGYL